MTGGVPEAGQSGSSAARQLDGKATAAARNAEHPDRVKAELARRFGLSGIEEKNSRKG